MEYILICVLIGIVLGGGKLFYSSGRNWKMEAEMMKCQAEALRRPKTETQIAYEKFQDAIFKANHPWADPESWNTKLAMNPIYLKMLCDLDAKPEPFDPTDSYRLINGAEV